MIYNVSCGKYLFTAKVKGGLKKLSGKIIVKIKICARFMNQPRHNRNVDNVPEWVAGRFHPNELRLAGLQSAAECGEIATVRQGEAKSPVFREAAKPIPYAVVE